VHLTSAFVYLTSAFVHGPPGVRLGVRGSTMAACAPDRTTP